MIDPLVEDLITPAEATGLYPRGLGGKKIHISKVYRDMRWGVRGVVLESIRTPRLATSRQAVTRFFWRLGELAKQPARANPVGSDCKRTDSAVEQELDRLGF